MARHRENIHANVIAKRTIFVDSNLVDWAGALLQSVRGNGLGASLTEQAYLPFKNFETGVSAGQATGYLAYDENYFYFAAKIADATPYELAGGRSVSKDDFLAFHNDWATHWANEIEFGWER